MPDSFASFANDEADAVVRDGEDLSEGRRRPVWRQQVVVEHGPHVKVSAHLVRGLQLLRPDRVARFLVRREHAVHEVPGHRELLLAVSDNEHMLLVCVVVRQRVSFFMRAFTPDQDSATSLLLEALLVDALGANDEPDEVHSLVLGQVDLSLELASTDEIARGLRHTSS